MTTASADPGVVAALVTCIGLLGTVLVFVIRASTQASRANAAVNNREPGSLTLSQQVAHIASDVENLVDAQRDFAARGWAALPDDLGTSAGLTQTIRELQSQTAHVSQQLERLSATVSEHDRWERSTKA